MKVMVWNVNGLRACADKGFLDWLKKAKPDVLGVQEVRALPHQIPEAITSLKGFATHWFPAKRPGYSGVGLLFRKKPLAIHEGVGQAEFDDEGRCVIAEFDSWVFINAYFPKGSGKDRDNSRVPFKLAFYKAVLDVANSWRARERGVIIGGDFNTAHREIDLRNWKSNQDTSGFLPEERAWIDQYLEAGFVDVFRRDHVDEDGHYSWWSQRQGARARNVGWRIDYLLASDDLAKRVTKTWIEPKVLGSDHAPVGIEFR